MGKVVKKYDKKVNDLQMVVFIFILNKIFVINIIFKLGLMSYKNNFFNKLDVILFQYFFNHFF